MSTFASNFYTGCAELKMCYYTKLVFLCK